MGDTLIATLKEAVIWLPACLIIFAVLKKFWIANPAITWRRADVVTDLMYWLVTPLLYAVIYLGIVTLGAAMIFKDDQESLKHFLLYGTEPLNNLPLWVQCILVLFISDFIQYWLHRWFHSGGLWKYHAIHHSTVPLDWLSTKRFHPLNHIPSFTLVAAMVILMGFAPAVFIILGPFNIVYSALVHANLRWDFGPFRTVLASPVFHRWHHTTLERGMDKNFAPTFPILDILFGTYYMPKGEIPDHFGIKDSDVPEDFLGQLVYPFKSKS